MKHKAIVVGGSNGIGLAVSRKLIDRGYFVTIFDKCAPESNSFQANQFQYTYCNLLDFNEELFASLVNDKDIEVLIITAGIGRIAEFQAHHIVEIDNIFEIDTISTIKIIRILYERIRSSETFFTGVIGSISGWLSSPCASVYAAAKAGVIRFIESVNIELEAAGLNNRILDISPASFKGSRFYGGENDISALEPLANQILFHLFNRDTLFIPQYEEIYKAVIERYHDNPREYGLHSYNYKKESGRLDNSKKVTVGYLSGTFDLFHVGHLNLLERAKEKCDYLIVGVHESGKWKGKDTFISFEERKRIVKACRYVDKVVDACREDSDMWNLYHYDYLFVGSDYKGTERFKQYEEYFKSKNVEIIYFPYTQSTSSTQIRKAITEATDKE